MLFDLRDNFMMEQKFNFTSYAVRNFDFWQSSSERTPYPIRLNKLFVHFDKSMSMFRTALEYFWMRALPAAMARLKFTRASRELTALIYDWTISSSSPSKRGHPLGFEYCFSDCGTSCCSFEASFISFITLVLNERMVLSFNPGNFNLYFRRAAELPFTRT